MDSAFQPGFRFSKLDAVILITGTGFALLSGRQFLPMAFIVGIVLLHFFLFCNVFRISRTPELIWAGVFLTLCMATIFFQVPGWTVAFILAFIFGGILIAIETKKPHYHGIFWRRWNPALPDWWDKKSG